MNRFVLTVCGLSFVAGTVLLSSGARAQQAELQPDHKALAPDGEFWGVLPFFNTTVPLFVDRPDSVTKEPKYSGTPLYGHLKLGNTSRSGYTVVVDHPKAGEWDQCRVYVDANRNGDLTDDGDGQWGKVAARPGATAARLGPKLVQLRASYSDGSDDQEVDARPYTVMFLYVKPGPDSGMQLSYRRVTSFQGEIELGGKKQRVAMVENDNDALFRTVKGENSKPLWLFVDADGNGRFSDAERHDMRGAFTINGQNYVARPAAHGVRVQLTPFTGEVPPRREAGTQAPPAPRIPLLTAGTPAPDFAALKPDGSELRLSDYRGKVVVLDFWATWCGPCKKAMPHVESIHNKTRSMGVEVIGVCVWDTREAFDKWQTEPAVPTTFTKVFDPAGQNRGNGNADSIAKKHYNVSGIPTMYVIDREGKVVEGIVGFRGEGDERLTEALRKAGVAL